MATEVTPYVQPPFDPRITSLPAPFSNNQSSITRGFLIWDKNAMPGGNVSVYNTPAIVQFLFNPSTISTSYQLADGSAQAALNYGSSGVTGGLLLPLQQQVSFSIMFDRTYELNTPSTYLATPGIQYHGVDVDVAAMRQYTGMFADVYGGNNQYYAYSANDVSQTGVGHTGASAQTSQWNSPMGSLSQGIMQVTLGYLYFGGTQAGPAAAATGGVPASGSNSSQNWGITYYGYIDSWSVEYTHFTQWMVPLRCVIDVSFTLLPPPATAPDANGAAVVAARQKVSGVGPTALPGNVPNNQLPAQLQTTPAQGIGGR